MIRPLVMLRLNFLLYLVLSSSSVAIAGDSLRKLVELDRASLEILEQRGLVLASMLGAPASNTRELAKSTMFRDFKAVIETDLTNEVVEISKSNGDSARTIDLFQGEWLNSIHSEFKLVGIVARPDRRHVNEQTCGEIRLIFRLSYRKIGDEDLTFLPMTVMTVFPTPRQHADCRQAFLLDNEGQFAILKQILNRTLKFDRIETNYLISNLSYSGNPPASEESKYILRTFSANHASKRLTPNLLENSPDVALLSKDANLMERFVRWAKSADTIKMVESGLMLLPAEFATEKAMSISPYAVVRRVNAPYSQLLEPTGIFSAAFLGRMDSLSCQGCHQIRSVAGFHLPGTQDEKAVPALISAGSPHFQSIQKWRALDLNSANLSSQPLPNLFRLSDGGMGDRCLDSKDPSSACGPGHYCDFDYAGFDTLTYGQCLPKLPSSFGSPCDPTQVVGAVDGNSAIFIERPLNSCGHEKFCAFSSAGFSGGYCASYCSILPGQGNCVSFPTLGPFTACVEKTGNHGYCAGKHSILASMETCQLHADCRTDYACARFQEDLTVCAPTYVVPGLTLKHKIH